MSRNPFEEMRMKYLTADKRLLNSTDPGGKKSKRKRSEGAE
jgi:hypothetical protein